MKKQPLSSPFHVLIVAKTRLKRGFCVGGIAQKGCSVRLNVPVNPAVEGSNHEYEIGDVWLIEEYTIRHNLKAPHLEDIDVLSKKYIKVSDRPCAAIEQLMPPVVGGIELLFDGAVRRFENGRLY